MTPKRNTTNQNIRSQRPTAVPATTPPPTEIPTDWLTVREVAEMLRSSEQSIRRAMWSGKLRSAEIAGGRKTRSVWLAEYIEAATKLGPEDFQDPIEVKNRHSSPGPEASGMAS